MIDQITVSSAVGKFFTDMHELTVSSEFVGRFVAEQTVAWGFNSQACKKLSEEVQLWFSTHGREHLSSPTAFQLVISAPLDDIMSNLEAASNKSDPKNIDFDLDFRELTDEALTMVNQGNCEGAYQITFEDMMSI